MKKVMVACLLSGVAAAMVPGATVAFSQAPAAAPAAAAGQGQVQLSQAEYAAYTNATSQSTPQTKAPALEAYLTQFPQSPVKVDVLQQLMLAYSGFDPAKTIDAADRLLQVDPTNLRALTFEVYFRSTLAGQLTDAAAKQTALDTTAGFAVKGVAATEQTLPKGMTQADFDSVKATGLPFFYSAIGADDMGKNDFAGAIDAFTSELKSVPLEKTQAVGPVLQDTFLLGVAYEKAATPDYVKCTFFATRAASYAPDNFKSQIQPTATYCYHKFHGNNDDGYPAVITAAKANLFPPADFTITPRPKPADIVHQLIVSTPDLATLALSDKEFILQNGSPEDADKVFATIKGKSVEIPGVVIESTPTVLKVAVSEDAIQSKTADFTFNLKPVDPAAAKTAAQKAAATKLATETADATAVGKTVKLTGTYASYTASPIMITMNDGEVVLKKAAAAPVRRAAPARRR